jgi:uncharacterized protein
MITQVELQKLIKDQLQKFGRKQLINREKKIPELRDRIIVLTGIRSCGKSTLLWQNLSERGKILYMNFDDPRLIEFSISDFSTLEKIFVDGEYELLVLDEVQLISQWELYVRMAHEKGISLFVSGSNASILSQEFGTKLSGQYSQVELFPFSYGEFLSCFGKNATYNSFQEFFEKGGFPENLYTGDPEFHSTLLKDIIAHDIAVRRTITDESSLMRLAVFLLVNIGKEMSLNNIAKTLEFASVRTVIDYCDYIEESYLVDFVPIYSHPSKKQMVNLRKVYAIDAAFAKSNSKSFSLDKGRRFENMVYNHLRRQFKEILYYRDTDSECDFVVKENDEITHVIQVCWEVNHDNMNREMKGIQRALKTTKCTNGIIITADQEDKLENIHLIPFWKWAMGA